MGKKECPSCAMEIGVSERECPICGYEFSARPNYNRIVALILVIIFILFFVISRI